MSDTYTQGQSNIDKAYQAGTQNLGSFNPTDWQQQTSQGYNSLFGNQQQGVNDYIQGFKNQILNQPQAADLYKQGNDQYNVQPLAQQANSLNNAVLQAPQMNLDRAKGFNMDNNAVQAQTNQDLMRLQPLASAANNNLQTAQGLASGYANAGMQQNQMNLTPYQTEGTMINDLYARQATGFGQQQEDTLNALTEKMKQGIALTSQEIQAYSQLSTAEDAYQAAIQSAQTTANASTQNAQTQFQNQILQPGSTYYNPKLGTAYNPAFTPAKP